MIDENAFGLLLSHHAIEDEEYGLETASFLERVALLRETTQQWLLDAPLAPSLRQLDLGHALYFEWSDGEQLTGPIAWLKELRRRLTEAALESTGILSHGGRWVANEEGEPEFGPSEALRRALYAETAVHPDEDSDNPGWGSGLYLDTEAVEALGLKLKNAPTPLSSAGATFYRAGA
jgi:hypothetical protein